VTGCYVPRVLTGAPVSGEKAGKYLTSEVDGIKIYYPPGLQIKQGFSEIRIRLKRFLFVAWLEAEGAKAIPVFDK